MAPPKEELPQNYQAIRIDEGQGDEGAEEGSMKHFFQSYTKQILILVAVVSVVLGLAVGKVSKTGQLNVSEIASEVPDGLFNPKNHLVSYQDAGNCGPRGDDAKATLDVCTVLPGGSYKIVDEVKYAGWKVVATVDGCDYFAYTVYECIIEEVPDVTPDGEIQPSVSDQTSTTDEVPDVTPDGEIQPSVSDQTSTTEEVIEETAFDPTSELVSYVDHESCGPRGDDAKAKLGVCTAVPGGSYKIIDEMKNDGWKIAAAIGGCDYYSYTVYECTTEEVPDVTPDVIQPSVSVSTQPSVSFKESTIALIQLRSASTDFTISTSPQSQSLDWILSNPSCFDGVKDDILVQRFALVTLYFSTIGTEWKKDMLDCDTDSEEKAIDFSTFGSGTSGLIPIEIGLLTQLTSLVMAGTKAEQSTIGGSLPSELGLLTQLTLLSIRFNDLTGSLPSEFGLMSNLTAVKLRGNRLSGSLPTQLGLLNQLTLLRLFNNELTGLIPTELGLLSQLEILNLKRNDKLTGNIPSSLCDIPKINIDCVKITCSCDQCRC